MKQSEDFYKMGNYEDKIYSLSETVPGRSATTKKQGEKRSCVPGEKQGFRVWIRGRDKAGNVAKPESGSFCRIQV